MNQRPPARLEPLPRGEALRIAGSVTLFCAAGAAILGVVYVATHRYEEAARLRTERSAVSTLLGLDPGAEVKEVRQFLDPARRRVMYRIEPDAHGKGGTQLVFSLDGALVSRDAVAPRTGAVDETLDPLGRLFVAFERGRRAGFVIEGDTRGYKNVIRFFVALDSSFDVAGVRVVQHEEDPGLGAEVASSWFQGQYMGRSSDEIENLEVTRDPMPEDWRVALARLDRVPPARWREETGRLRSRERSRPIYAVTGATISSRALTDGVRTTVRHFRRRYALLAPYLAEPPS